MRLSHKLFDLLDSYEAIVFDLDNTLIIETDYLFQAYYTISNRFENSDLVYKYLRKQFLLFGRKGLFEKLIAFTNADYSIDAFLSDLRTAEIKPLQLSTRALPILQHLKDKGIPYGVLTNGNPIQQRNKVKHIEWKGLKPHDNYIIYANEIKMKPNPEGLLHLLNQFSISKDKLLFIGDSESDKLCALNAVIDYWDIKDC